MKTSVVLVTPELAAEYLSKNIGNRKINESHLEFLVKQMQKGTFKEETGDAIRFTGDFEKLIDGQHRLTAIIKSNKSFNLLIITDCNIDAFSVIDTGRTRKASDILSIKNFKHSTLLATAVRKYLVLNNSDSRKLLAAKRLGFNNEDILNATIKLSEELDLNEIVTIGYSLRYQSVNTINLSSLCCFIIMFLMKNPFKRQQILEALKSDKSNDCFIEYFKDITLRRKIITEHEEAQLYFFVCKCWINGKQYKKIPVSYYLDIEEFNFIIK